MTLARMMVYYLITLHLMLVAGCLCEPGGSTAAAPDFDDSGPVTLFDEANQRYLPPVEIVTAKPVSLAAASQEPEPAAFTGAVVHVSADCEPCHWLLTDLEMLRTDHNWTIVEATENRPADWVIEWNSTAVDRFPLIDFYHGGVVQASHAGYVTSSDFGDRRDTLAGLVATHNRTRKHGQAAGPLNVPQPPN